MATRARPSTRGAEHGSRTLTLNETRPEDADRGASSADEASTSNSNIAGVLRLRGGPSVNAPRVQWDTEVIDNEGMGKKKSKSASHEPSSRYVS